MNTIPLPGGGTCLQATTRQFARWSRTYDTSPLQPLLFMPTHREVLKRVVGVARMVLDVGCGTGRLLRLLRQRGHTTVGFDLTDGMLKRASGLRVRGNAVGLPFVNESFDYLICCHSFHHYPCQLTALREFCRVLRPGGRLILADGSGDGWLGWLVFDGIVPMVEGTVHHCRAREMRALLQRSGLAMVEQTTCKAVPPLLLTVAGVA